VLYDAFQHATNTTGRSNVANVEQLDIDQAVVAVAELATQYYGGNVVRVHIDLQGNGEHPYRVEVLDEPVPLAGVGVGIPLSDLGGEIRAAKPDTSEGTS
jgi:hypothetical protein